MIHHVQLVYLRILRVIEHINSKFPSQACATYLNVLIHILFKTLSVTHNGHLHPLKHIKIKLHKIKKTKQKSQPSSAS